MGNENVMTNVYRVQAYDSIMCRYVCIGFTDFILKGKSLLEYTTFFSLNDYEKNYKIILKYFQQNLNKSKGIALFIINMEK